MIFLFVEKLLFVIITVLMLIILLCFASFVLSPAHNISAELSSYECGLQPYNNNIGVFNLFSYKLSMLFILLESEIVFVFLFVYFDYTMPVFGWISFLVLMIFILLSIVAEICLNFLDFVIW